MNYPTKILFIILAAIISLLLLPPFYMLPIKSPIFSSHTIASILTIGIFLTTQVNLLRTKYQLPINNILKVLILGYLLTQSISMINATNIAAFMQQYKNIVISLLLFTSSTIILNSTRKKNNLLVVIVFVVSIQVVWQTFVLFFPSIIESVFKPFLYEPFWISLETQYQRGRFFHDIFNPSLIPLLYTVLNNKRKKLLLATLIALAIVFLSIASNFRANFIISVFAVLATAVIMSKSSRKLFLTLSILGIILFSITQISFFGNTGALSRLITPEKRDIETIEGRFEMWNESIILSQQNPIVGVGIGNFYDNLPNKEIFRYSFFDWKNTHARLTEIDPHNIFFKNLAETGVLGTTFLILLVGYFLVKDLSIIKSNNYQMKLISLSFWLTALFSLATPSFILPYMSLLWILRALLNSDEP